MTATELIALNEEIAAMARAGLPLDQGLAAFAREMGRGRLRRVTAAIADDLRAGRTLPEALEKRGKEVPPFYAALVAAGTRTGRIAEVLATLTAYARSLAQVRSIIADALFYPGVIIAFAVALFGALFYFVLPQFRDIFREFGMALPALTQAVFEVSRRPDLYLALPLGAVVLAMVLYRVSVRTTDKGRRWWAQVVYGVPVLGTLIKSARLAAFTELLAILVDHHIPLAEAFRLAGEASSEPLMAYHARIVYHALTEGSTLADALRDRGLVPEWVSWMAGQGERKGQLGPTLHQVAEMYRRQVEMRAALLRHVLPPIMIIFLAGGLLLAFVLTVMLPMFKLLEGLSN